MQTESPIIVTPVRIALLFSPAGTAGISGSDGLGGESSGLLVSGGATGNAVGGMASDGVAGYVAGVLGSGEIAGEADGVLVSGIVVGEAVDMSDSNGASGVLAGVWVSFAAVWAPARSEGVVCAVCGSAASELPCRLPAAVKESEIFNGVLLIARVKLLSSMIESASW